MGVQLAETGFKAGLDAAVEEARQQELNRLAGQLDLFGSDPGPTASTAPLPVATGQRGPGRPLGARNKRTDEAARFYMSRFGDPLSRGVEISALPILANGGQVLLELSKVLGLSRGDAAKWWLGVYSATLPFVHQRLSTLTVRPEGAPDGEAVSWAFADDQVLEAITRPSEGRELEDELEAITRPGEGRELDAVEP